MTVVLIIAPKRLYTAYLDFATRLVLLVLLWLDTPDRTNEM